MLFRFMKSVGLNVEFGGNNKRLNVRSSPSTGSHCELCICTWEADIISASSKSEIRSGVKGSKKEKPGLLSCISTAIGCAHRHT